MGINGFDSLQRFRFEAKKVIFSLTFYDKV